MATIAVIGGTGHEGFGLAVRWWQAGHRVLIGSRDPEKARQAVARAQEAYAQAAAGGSLVGAGVAGPGELAGAANGEAARLADVVVLTIPFQGQAAILGDLKEALRGRVVVDTTVPLRSFRPPELEEIPEGSSAQRVQALLPEARVVAAFHTISAVKLTDLKRRLDEDILICGDDAQARELVAKLAGDIGLRGIDAGPLRHARTLELVACLVIGLNQRYRRQAIGIRFDGL